MRIEYTNSRGVTYCLCRCLTTAGNPRYVFARRPKGEPVEEVPAGYRISESVNGVVSLARDLPPVIRSDELRAVEAAIRRRPRSGNHRAAIRRDRIEVYERNGPDVDQIVASFRQTGVPEAANPDFVARMQADLETLGRFTPVLRFILEDATKRTFWVERWCYVSSMDDWVHVGSSGPIEPLARKWIPLLGTDRLFFEY